MIPDRRRWRGPLRPIDRCSTIGALVEPPRACPRRPPPPGRPLCSGPNHAGRAPAPGAAENLGRLLLARHGRRRRRATVVRSPVLCWPALTSLATLFAFANSFSSLLASSARRADALPFRSTVEVHPQFKYTSRGGALLLRRLCTKPGVDSVAALSSRCLLQTKER